MNSNPNTARGVIGTRTFSMDDQIIFSRFSGDVNPIHLDPVAARRTLAGRCVVHGMHSLLWMLDTLARANVAVASFRVKFLKPVFLGEPVECLWDRVSNAVSLSTEGTLLVTMTVVLGIVEFDTAEPWITISPLSKPEEPTFSQCRNISCQPIQIYGDASLAQTLFPGAQATYGLTAVCEIAALSYVVGMQCPGLRSLFFSLRLQFARGNRHAPTYSVVRCDERFNLLRISVASRTGAGEIEAFYRPAPINQLSIADCAKHVGRNEFERAYALIIGGSRGLGEAVAKLIGAGGGHVIVTYNEGWREAQELATEIQSFGGDCTISQLTVGKDTQLPNELLVFNQLYYFATPKIFGKRSQGFSNELYESFADIYVTAFASICDQLTQRAQTCAVLYPSTVAIEQPVPELFEYAKAKERGEALCVTLGEKGSLGIICPRLPRLATDQTQSITNVPVQDSIAVLLPIVRELYRRTPTLLLSP
jgi:hypothetical protein